MMTLPRSSTPLLLLLMVSCATTPATPDQAPAETVEKPTDVDPLGVQVHTLDNGLTVYLSENHEEPRISAWVGIRAGGAQDPRDATGMAHYLEHMLAGKGTQSMGTLDYAAEKPHLDRIRELYDELFEVTDETERERIYKEIDAEGQKANGYAIANEVRQAYELIGGRGHNAFTNHDQTTYIVDVPANKLKVWAAIEGDRFSSAVFRGFHTEVEAVYEEKNRALDNAGRRVRAAMDEALWGDHPYAVEVLGTVEHLKRPSVSKMEAYFNTWYVPENMAVALAGDFDSDEALALVKQAFGGLPAKAAPEIAPRPVKPLDAPVERTVAHHGDEEIHMAWLTVPEGHKDHAALQVADMLLNNSATGLLDVNLNQAQKVWQSGSSPDFRREAGRQQIWGRPKAEQSLDEVKALLLEQVAKLKAGEFSEEDLAAIILDFEIGEKQRLEANQARVNMMMDSFVVGQPWDFYRHHLDRLRAVTKEDVVRVANTYLGDNFATVKRVDGSPEIPDIKAPELTSLELNTDDHSPFFKKVVSIETPAIEPQDLTAGEDYFIVETEAGRLYATPNPYNDLFQVTWRWQSGFNHHQAICDALNLWEKAGAGDMDEAAYRKALYELGVSVGTSCNERWTSVSFWGPAENMAKASELVRLRLSNPALTEEKIDVYFADLFAKREAHKATQRLQSSALNSYALFGDESYYLTKPLTAEEADALTVAEVSKLTASRANLKGTVVYAGPHDPKEAATILVPEGVDWQAPPATEPERFVETDAPRLLLLDHDSVQASIQFSIPGDIVDPDDYAVTRALNAYIGGASGLIFQEIRESRALAYSAYGGYSQSNLPGSQDRLWGFIGTQADKSPEAISVLVELMDDLPALPTRWETARSSAVEGLRAERIAYRNVGYTAHDWYLLGRSSDPRPAAITTLETMTLDDLKRFVDEVNTRPMTITLVGDLDRIDIPALEAVAPVTQMKLEELLRY